MDHSDEWKMRFARELADAIARKSLERGQYIEANFQTMLIATYGDKLDTMHEKTLEALRMSFFGGAGAIFGLLTDDIVPDNEWEDMICCVSSELDQYVVDFSKKHGLPCPQKKFTD